MYHALPCTTALLLALLVGNAHARDAQPAAAQSAATPLAAVTVEATAADSRANVGSIDGAPLANTPVSINVIGRRRLDIMQPRDLIEVMHADASVSDSYAAVGYYQNLSIRGFPLNLDSSYRLNGLTTTGRQRISFANKQSVQVLKGLAGINAGIVTPGGLVNYVTERPAEVREITLGTDSHGTRRVALDYGTWLTPELGIRLNVAWRDLHSYVDHADGRSNFYSLALDWMPSDAVTLRIDSSYHTSARNSVSGYQLLGGTQLPQDVHPGWLLGYQPWQQPVTIRTANTTIRLDWELSDDWKLRLATGHSRSVIDDNVAYAWGCYGTEACAGGAAPGGFFGPDGSYDIYDFRSPDDTRRNDEARVILNGELGRGSVVHELSLGLDYVRRTTDQRAWVYDYVGSGNIHQRTPPVYAPSPAEPGPLVRRLVNWQRSALLQDRIHFGDHWQLLAALRKVRMHERTWNDDGSPARETRLQPTLPQAAVLWLPSADLTAYLSYSEGLSLGRTAPASTSNAGTILPPTTARQLEAGIKLAAGNHVKLSAALFRMRRPYQFTRADDSPAGATFVQQGEALHRGLEVAIHGQVTPRLRLDGSALWLDAHAQGTGTPLREDQQLLGIPKLQLALLADYQLAFAPGLHLLAGWRHSGSRSATVDGSESADAYNVFDLGLRYRLRVGGNRIDWHLMVSNVFDTFYWRDVSSEYLGSHYLFPGAPRQARLSVSWSF